MTAIFTILTSRAGMIVAAVLALVLFYEGVPLLIDGRVDEEYRRGATDERLIWQKRQAEADRKHIADVNSKQDEIDQITLEYLNTKADRRVAETALAAAIAAAEKEDENDAPNTGPVCRRFIPRGVSNQLDRIGQ